MKTVITDTLFLRTGQDVETYNAENVHTSEGNLLSHPSNQ